MDFFGDDDNVSVGGHAVIVTVALDGPENAVTLKSCCLEIVFTCQKGPTCIGMLLQVPSLDRGTLEFSRFQPDGRLAVPPGFCKAAGTLYPIALSGRFLPVFPSLRLHASLRVPGSKLAPQHFVNPKGLLNVYHPIFPSQQDMDPPVSIPDAYLVNPSDPLLQRGLAGATGLVVIC